jgi:hypothetical protein
LALATVYNNWFGQQPPVKSPLMFGVQVGAVGAMIQDLRADTVVGEASLEKHLL